MASDISDLDEESTGGAEAMLDRLLRSDASSDGDAWEAASSPRDGAGAVDEQPTRQHDAQSSPR